MKKQTPIIGLLAVLLSGSVFGQAPDMRDQITVGIKGGVNLSNVYDSEGEDFEADAKTGFAAGLSLTVPITTLIGLQPEILVSQRGFMASGTMLGSPYMFTRTTTFLDIPLLLAIRPTNYFTIVAGPQYSYLMAQRDVFASGSSTFAQEQEFNNDDARRNMLCVTGGFDVTLNHFLIGGRLGWDVRNNREDGSSYTPRYKNVWYQLTIGVRI